MRDHVEDQREAVAQDQADACPGSGHRVTGPEITRERGKTPMARCPECKQPVEVYEAGAGRHWRAMRKWHLALQPTLSPQDQEPAEPTIMHLVIEATTGRTACGIPAEGEFTKAPADMNVGDDNICVECANSGATVGELLGWTRRQASSSLADAIFTDREPNEPGRR